MRQYPVSVFFLGLAAVLAVAALVLLVMRPDEQPVPAPVLAEQEEVAGEPEKIEGIDEVVLDAAEPAAELEDLGIGLETSTPEELLARVADALASGDAGVIESLLVGGALDRETVERLAALGLNGHAAGAGGLRFAKGFREVGELELNTRSRWSLEYEDGAGGKGEVFLDLKRAGGRWSLEKVVFPDGGGADGSDSLVVADTFLQAVLRQDFEFARAGVDQDGVSDAKIAGLCILFEEGGYRLRQAKPLRAMFRRERAVGFLANVETVDGGESAQFTLALRQPEGGARWMISEINLDQLLADYARRVAGGDVYYSPLVKNPAGGDTLALYFDFDEDEMNERTLRQLEIVSMLLKADSGKRVTLSGHTDALGSKAYNDGLSKRRADSVRDLLVKAGVDEAQIVTLAKGASQPRRPNVTESGEDDPTGRRVNRRTEIYLDF